MQFYAKGDKKRWVKYLTEKQDGKCAICKRSKGIRLGLDHDHILNEPRAMLCTACNLAVGMVQEHPDTAMALYHYVVLCREWRHKDGKTQKANRKTGVEIGGPTSFPLAFRDEAKPAAKPDWMADPSLLPKKPPVAA